MAEKFFAESVEHVATMSNLNKCSICSRIGAKPWAKSQFNLSLAKLSPTLFLYITGFYNPLEKPRKNMITTFLDCSVFWMIYCNSIIVLHQ